MSVMEGGCGREEVTLKPKLNMCSSRGSIGEGRGESKDEKGSVQEQGRAHRKTDLKVKSRTLETEKNTHNVVRVP